MIARISVKCNWRLIRTIVHTINIFRAQGWFNFYPTKGIITFNFSSHHYNWFDRQWGNRQFHCGTWRTCTNTIWFDGIISDCIYRVERWWSYHISANRTVVPDHGFACVGNRISRIKCNLRGTGTHQQISRTYRSSRHGNNGQSYRSSGGTWTRTIDSLSIIGYSTWLIQNGFRNCLSWSIIPNNRCPVSRRYNAFIGIEFLNRAGFTFCRNRNSYRVCRCNWLNIDRNQSVSYTKRTQFPYFNQMITWC